MTKILFVCHGNICRSPTAEFVMKHMVAQAGLQDEYEIASAATSTEELGSPVYAPSRRKMSEHGIDCSGKTVRLLLREDYNHYDLLIGMDDANLRNMRRIFGADSAGKIHAMMEYAGKPGASVADPWYTRDFDQTWRDINEGCEGLLYQLSDTVIIDFSACTNRRELYNELRAKMEWEEWYSENLDALNDILTGLPYKGNRFVLRMPVDAAVKAYAEKVAEVFENAGIPCFVY